MLNAVKLLVILVLLFNHTDSAIYHLRLYCAKTKQSNTVILAAQDLEDLPKCLYIYIYIYIYIYWNSWYLLDKFMSLHDID